MINESALTYWKYNGYTAEEVNNVFSEAGEANLCMKVDFSGGRSAQITLSQRVVKTAQGHANEISRFLEEMLLDSPDNFPDGTVLFWLMDGLFDYRQCFVRRIPIFAFGRGYSDTRTLVIPDPAFLGSRAYDQVLMEIRNVEKDCPWERKHQTVYWRGASSGHLVDSENWKNAPRIKLALIGKETNDMSTIDVSISRVPNYTDPKIAQRIYDEGIVSKEVPFLEFVPYRYQIDVDGYSSAWISCYLKLSMDSVLLKVQGKQVQWYYDQLIPWKHFIPISDDLSDFLEIVDWLPSHDVQCKEIAANSTALMNSINYLGAKAKVEKLIRTVLSYQRIMPNR